MTILSNSIPPSTSHSTQVFCNKDQIEGQFSSGVWWGKGKKAQKGNYGAILRGLFIAKGTNFFFKLALYLK